MMQRCLLGVVLVICGLAPASAQQRIFARVGATRLATQLWEGSIESGQLIDVRLLTIADGGTSIPVIAGGGEFLVWSVFYALSVPAPLEVFDRTSHHTHRFYPSTDPGSIPDPQVADPTRLRVFVRGDAGIISLTAAGAAALPGTRGLTPEAMSTDGTRLYATRTSGPAPFGSDICVLDAESGTSLSTFAAGVSLRGLSPSDADRVVVISARAEAPQIPLLRQFDVTTGQERFAVSLPSTPDPLNTRHAIIGVDGTRRRVVTRTESTPSGAPPVTTIAAYDIDTGARSWDVALDGEAEAGMDRGAGTVLALANSKGTGTLVSLSTMNGQLLTSVPLGSIPRLGATIATPPLPPTVDPAQVSPGRQVGIRWTPSPELTRGSTIEAGSAPGLANLAVLPVTTETSLVVPSVPPGTYYVRVRAWNYIGPSVPSNEIVVAVP